MMLIFTDGGSSASNRGSSPFTPSVTADYAFTTCAGNGATGSTVYDTIVAVLDSTGGACPSTASLACNDTNTACPQPIPGAPYLDQATVGAIALTWAISRFALDIPWRALPLVSLSGIGVSAVLVALVGVMASWEVLQRKPLATLRAE